MKYSIITSVFAFLLFVTPFAWSFGPPAEDVEIISVQANGTGCPVGSTTELIVDTLGDGTADFFQVIFSDFFVEDPPGPKIKNCLVEVLLKIPNGWSFSLFDVAYEGFASLAPSMSGVLYTKYEFPFFSNEVTTSKWLRRGYFGPFEKEDTLGIFATVWSPCGIRAPLNMNSRLALFGRSGPYDYSFMGVEVQSGLLTQLWGMKWRKCDDDSAEEYGFTDMSPLEMLQ